MHVPRNPVVEEVVYFADSKKTAGRDLGRLGQAVYFVDTVRTAAYDLATWARMGGDERNEIAGWLKDQLKGEVASLLAADNSPRDVY